MARVEMLDVEATLLREAEDKAVTQKSMAYTYAFGLAGSEQINWAAVNRAILDHRSLPALTNIKTLAWRLVDKRQAAEKTSTHTPTEDA